MTAKKALLNTEFITEQWIRERNKSWKFTQEDIERSLKAKKLLNGQVAILSSETFGLDGADYPIYGLENDDVFKESFWNEISDQTGSKTSCFANESINEDKFMSIPMDEGTLTFMLSTLISVQKYQRK